MKLKQKLDKLKEQRQLNQQSSEKGNQRPIHSSWKIDKRFEETSMNYLSNSPIFNDLNVKEIINDRPRQLKGIDIIAEINKKESNVDVKAIASQLPTFCFEISGNVHSGQVGWLLKEDLETDYYLIVYHEVKGAEKNYNLGKKIMTYDNIIKTEAFLISKIKLKHRIEKQFGMKLEEVVSYIRELKLEGDKVIRFHNDLTIQEGKGNRNLNIYPTISLNIYEQPINIVIRKEVLKELADNHWII